MAGNERVVNLAVRAKDEFSKVFKTLEEAGRKVQLQFVRDTRKAIGDTAVEIQSVDKAMRSLVASGSGSGQAIADLVVQKGKLIEKADKLKRSLDTVKASLDSTSPKGNFNSFSQLASSMDVSAARASRLKGNIDTLNAEIGRLVTAQKAVLTSNPFAAQDLGRQATSYIQDVRRIKTELASLQDAQRATSAAQPGSFKAFSQGVGDSPVASGLQAQVKATQQAVAATVPVLQQKQVETRKAAVVDQDLIEAERTLTALTREMTTAEERWEQQTKRLVAQRQVLSRSFGENSTQVARFDAAMKRREKTRSERRGEAADVEVFGLKPWQLTNLGYQANDVISGLAMGQKPVQILAQQAGQIAQIWPNVMTTLARSIPVVGGLAAAFAPLIAAISRTVQTAQSLKIFRAELALSADGARYSAEEMTRAAEAISKLGVSMDDARKLVSEFAKDGFDTKQMVDMTTMAKRLAAVTGGEVPDAARKLAAAFTGNVDSVRDLDRELNFLTASQLANLRSMEEGGKRAEAMATAQGILRDKLQGTVGPTNDWGNAVTDLKDAWNELVEAVRNSGIIEMGAKGLGVLGQSARGWSRIIKGVNGQLGSSEAESLGKRGLTLRDETIPGLERDIKTATDTGMTILAGQLTDQLAEARAELDQIKVRLREINAPQNAEITAEMAAAAVRANEASEAQKKNQDEVNATVREYLTGLQDTYDTTLLTSREQYIQNALLDARNKAMAEANKLGVEFLGLTQQQNDAIRNQAGQLFDRQQSTALMGNLQSYVGKVTSAESSGDPNAKNKNSSATGLGQFIESTWLNMFRKYYPQEAARMGEDAILELRKDAAVSQNMVALYAKENADVLQKAGIAITEQSLYLAHFLGPQGAAGVMAARASAPVDQILGAGQINANKSVLQGKNAGEVRDWAANKMGRSEEEVQINQRLVEIDTERQEKAEEYNRSYGDRLGNLQAEIAAQSQGAREAAIALAIRNEENAAAEAGLTLTQQQRDEVARLTGELFDRNNVEAEVNRLMEERDIMLQRLSMAQESGDTSKIAEAQEELANMDGVLLGAIDKAIAFWQAMGGPNADLAIEKLELLKEQLERQSYEMQSNFLPKAEELNESIAGKGADAFDALAQAWANGENKFVAFRDAVLSGIGDILIELGKAIAKQALFNAIAGSGGGGGIGGAISGWVAGIFHEGGIAGQGRTTRTVNPAYFANAARYHTGGIAGLKPNEVPAVLEKDEEILPADHPRHRNNFSQPSVKVLNVLDPVEILEKALATEVGEKTMINWMSRRSRQLNGVLK